MLEWNWSFFLIECDWKNSRKKRMDKNFLKKISGHMHVMLLNRAVFFFCWRKKKIFARFWIFFEKNIDRIYIYIFRYQKWNQLSRYQPQRLVPPCISVLVFFCLGWADTHVNSIGKFGYPYLVVKSLELQKKQKSKKKYKRLG